MADKKALIAVGLVLLAGMSVHAGWMWSRWQRLRKVKPLKPLSAAWRARQERTDGRKGYVE